MTHEEIQTILREVRETLEQGILPFWLERGVDRECGGYVTCFDAGGEPLGDTDKYLVAQTRMLWGFSALYEEYRDERLREAARQGYSFVLRHFWDADALGWFWKVRRDGACLDAGKVACGEATALSALALYGRVFGNAEAVAYAERTFNLLQIHCADTLRGGYFENLERDWSPSAPGFSGGDRKSLEGHLHLMESFTTLAQATGREIHRRKLKEAIGVILRHMVDHAHGCGLGQFDIEFRPVPTIGVHRMWGGDDAADGAVEMPADTTSYGLNLELGWLLNRAADVLGYPRDHYTAHLRAFVDHALRHGFDGELGGVFRLGSPGGPAFATDKEWWQNCEALVGLLDIYERTGDEAYFEAFRKTWRFAREHFVHPAAGEWRQLLRRDGTPAVAALGNPWKTIFRTGRALLECKRRLERLQG